MILRKLFLLLVVMGWICNAAAETITVTGVVSGTWCADTVMVVGDISVPDGQTLTIDPGVQVRFTGQYQFNVEGRLSAVGTASDSIIFTRHNPTEESKWGGVRLLSADPGTNLEYCRIDWVRKHSPLGTSVWGGGLYIDTCSPTIRHCLITNNYARNDNQNGRGGGIDIEGECVPTIEYCHILRNESDSGGGIHVSIDANPYIRYNVIEANIGNYCGGGLYIRSNGVILRHNIIKDNLEDGWGGGGIAFWSTTQGPGSTNFVYNNLFVGNESTGAGGAIYSRYDNSWMYKNTFVDNAAERGGAIYVLNHSYDEPPTIVNSILRDNTAMTGAQILLDEGAGAHANITYNNIEGGWSGEGNIDQDPIFVSLLYSDYRLQWGSPCIDSGDPNVMYQDEDGTRGDMGAYFFDQSCPVRIIMIPHSLPIEIPATGGSFDYTLQLTNITATIQCATVWIEALLPSGMSTGPVIGPVTMDIPAETTVERERTQTVPGSAPVGVYSYVAYAQVNLDESMDSFTLIKAGACDGDPLAGWCSTGEGMDLPATVAEDGILVSGYPNPFNPSTVISYTLPAASFITLAVYDITGREVIRLVNGWRDAGVHEVTFDGTDIASGIYFYRLETGGLSTGGKLILVK